MRWILSRPIRASWIGVSLLILSVLGTMTMSDAQTRPVAGDQKTSPSKSDVPGKPLETATFGSGCFWCTEAVFQRLKGVHSVTSGYSGGQVKNPTYKQVCTGTTGHAEAVQVKYDPSRITYAELLEVFWKTHDPTTLNRQGNDVGTQYRSVIFYRNDQQRKEAEHYKRKLDESKVFSGPIVTEIESFREFFPAENYHQEYYNLNSRQPYCAFVIRPKIEKLEKVFHDKLKTGAAEPSKAER
jgi:peptide-methionine (S)-S-oxide reductase